MLVVVESGVAKESTTSTAHHLLILYMQYIMESDNCVYCAGPVLCKHSNGERASPAINS